MSGTSKAGDEHALEISNTISQYVNGRWQVGLPRKSENHNLPNSHSNAYRRLLEKKTRSG